MQKLTKLFIALAAFIAFSNSTVVAQTPTVAAPIPPVRAAAKVTSIFSGAYTPIAGITEFNPSWQQATIATSEDIAGNATLKYANLNYQGTQFGTSVNGLPMTHLHLDVWTVDLANLAVSLIAPGVGNERAVSMPLTANAWTALDIPLTAFTSQASFSVADIIQLKIAGVGSKTVFIDNIYFYDESAIVDVELPNAFTATKGLVTSTSVELLLNASDNKGAVVYEITYGATTVKFGGISGVQKSVIIDLLTASTDYSFSIVAMDPTGNTATNSPLSVLATTSVALPAAPEPTVDAADVISIYSNSYTNVSGTNFNPSWGQKTLSTFVDLGGNGALKYTNLDYQGTAFGSHVNATAAGMTHLHVDAYSSNETALSIYIISPGPKEFAVALTPLVLDVWNSFNIPLSSFTGVALNDLQEFKVVGVGGKTVYLDNLYFYKGAPASLGSVDEVNGIKLFPNPASDKVTLVAESEISEIVISNLFGQTVEVIAVNALETTVGLEQLVAGQYIVSVRLINGTVTTQKLVKK